VLLEIERTGREALVEMRRLVGVLRRGDERAELAPQPSLTTSSSSSTTSGVPDYRSP